jgi:hypothetical protein
MSGLPLDPGLYVNIFRVRLPDQRLSVMVASFSDCPSLQELRNEIDHARWRTRVYRYGEYIFGYGPDMHQLGIKGFQLQEIRILNHPKWCVRLIMEGLGDFLKQQGYRELVSLGRTTFYEPQPYRTAASGQLHVFRGYDLRTIYLWREHHPIFGLIVDIRWEIQDSNGRRLDTAAIAQYNAVTEVAEIQEEYLPGNRINPEVSRLRLQNHILPFVRKHREFELPVSENIKATLEEKPLRIILGV